MPITLQDVDPQVGGTLLLRERATSVDGGVVATTQARRERISKAVGWLVGVPLAIVLVIIVRLYWGSAYGYHPFYPVVLAVIVAAFEGVAVRNGVMSMLNATMGQPNERAETTLTAEWLAGVLPKMQLGRLDRFYCDSLLSLLRAEPGLTAQQTQAVLHELNCLVAAGRTLEGQAASARESAAGDPVERIEQEQARLAAQVEKESDPVIAEAARARLKLCETRLETARSLTQTRARLRAQQDLVDSAFGSIGSVLARAVSAQLAHTTADPKAIELAIGEMSSQTRAIEEAIRELSSLR